jgi:hypothetical protein
MTTATAHQVVVRDKFLLAAGLSLSKQFSHDLDR